jgi:hypothetical protein
MSEPCNCEHQDHFNFRVDGKGVVDRPRGLHEYMAKPAGDQWAWYIGHVCDYCAATCMVGWIVEDHVHGEGDCRHTAAG